jgi:hypothetical protein
MADTTYRRSIENDASPWDTIQRMAHEVGWWLTEPEAGVVAIVKPTPRVSAQTQGRLMATEPVPPKTREAESRIDYLARICESAGVRFENRVAAP